MCKDMNELRNKIIKYDLLVGLFMSLFIGLSLTFKCAIIYYLGIMIAIINFKISSILIEKLTITGNSFLLILISFFRIIAVVSVALPFVGKIEWISIYLLGFTSHLIIMMIYCMLKKEGSD